LFCKDWIFEGAEMDFPYFCCRFLRFFFFPPLLLPREARFLAREEEASTGSSGSESLLLSELVLKIDQLGINAGLWSLNKRL